MSLLWKALDPLLLRLRARLEHLDEHAPSPRLDRLARIAAVAADSARFFPEGAVDNAFERAAITIGEFAHIHGSLRVATPASRISIGHHSYVGPETRIDASDSITIGNHVLISHLVDIIDSNSHSLHAAERRQETIDEYELGRSRRWESIASAPIVIEDDVWIGTKSTILRGVRIGRGAVVAANSVVTRDVEPFTLVAGNPARVVRRLSDGFAE